MAQNRLSKRQFRVVGIGGVPGVPPGGLLAAGAPRSLFPLRFCREAAPRPVTVGRRIVPIHPSDGVGGSIEAAVVPIGRSRGLVRRCLRMSRVPACEGERGQQLRVLVVRDRTFVHVLRVEVNGPLWSFHRKVLATLGREGVGLAGGGARTNTPAGTYTITA